MVGILVGILVGAFVGGFVVGDVNVTYNKIKNAKNHLEQMNLIDKKRKFDLAALRITTI